ncbi:DNA-3-methyladenine glycosylase [Plebeiibacterium marinum]|uniref:Putative 3-methyladenine DNA glycosylase n=1 Tax=Plebeiibacterium marinum TaxID=2992111 RepID=A0AAE3MF74_9BACT|nr:DNA-3-methyladenine glycosylase [Plebeiobacterium marinum]MCW3806749.1 DNA-3-methyladenine glycosylase [Plebeiobacterium marinum]
MRLGEEFFKLGALELAPKLLGQKIVRCFEDGRKSEFVITEVEAYCGEEDLACHASKGRTNRTEVMYHRGGKVYVYLIYGMYWLLNFVCGNDGDPQAVLIRGVEGVSGPGRVGKALGLDKTFYGENLLFSDRLWLERGIDDLKVVASKRIGVEYAGPTWSNKKYRFFVDQ